MRPRPTSVSRVSTQRSSQSIARTRPASAKPLEKTKKTNFIKRNILRTSGAGPGGVESRVKYSRNYQAPRRKKTIIIQVRTVLLKYSPPWDRQIVSIEA